MTSMTIKDNKNSMIQQVRKAAAEAIVKVCRTASTLYELLSYFKVLNLDGKPAKESGLGKWNSIMRKAIADWYLNKKPFEVTLQVLFYLQYCKLSFFICPNRPSLSSSVLCIDILQYWLNNQKYIVYKWDAPSFLQLLPKLFDMPCMIQSRYLTFLLMLL